MSVSLLDLTQMMINSSGICFYLSEIALLIRQKKDRERQLPSGLKAHS